jgi:hypothetical protein
MGAKLKLPTKGEKHVEGLQGIFLKNILGLRWRKWHEAGKNCTLGNLVTCTARQLFIRCNEWVLWRGWKGRNATGVLIGKVEGKRTL